MMPTQDFSGMDGLAGNLLRVRLGMLLVNEHLKAKAFRVPVHLALGHEAIAVAVSAVMGEDDALCLTHRNIHYNLARAVSLRAELEELRLHDGGVAGGWLGSMNMCNPDRGIIYTSSILANDLCVATGVALGTRVRAMEAVTFAVCGDGSLEEGAFHESLELLKTFGLAAVLIVENNEWSLATKISERRCPIDVASLARAFDAPYEKLSGNNVFTYAEHLTRLRALALAQKAPVVVEVELSTLGDSRMPLPDGRGDKFINYHHGAAPTVTASEWPVIQSDARDPVHVLAESIGSGQAKQMARAVWAAAQEDMGR
jgi:pyruvate dehydrogenase E1 component alpha subunit